MILIYKTKTLALCLAGLYLLLPFQGFSAVRNQQSTIKKEIPAGTLQRVEQTVLLQKKSGETAHPKLGPILRKVLEEAEVTDSATALKKVIPSKSISSSNGELLVVVRPSEGCVTATLAPLLTAQGASIIRSNGESLKISIPLEKLESAAKLTQTGHIRTLEPPKRKAATGEGVAATLASTWHSYGFTGEGASVAVIDTGYMSLTTLVNAGELPADYIPVNLSSDSTIGDTEAHGSACAEIIYDLAPDAELHLIKIDDVSDLIAARDYCIAEGIDIISCSLGWDAINFHDGIAYDNWATTLEEHPVTIVNQMNDAGILCVFAAGNEQQQHTFINWGSSGDVLMLNGDETNLNLLFDSDGDTTFSSGSYINVYMTWNRWPVTDKNFNIYLYRNTGSGWNIVAASEDIQDGSTDSYPVEIIRHITTRSGQFGVYVKRYNNTETPWIILRYYGDVIYPNYWQYDDKYTPAPGSLCIPGDATSAFTVGAISHDEYPGGPIAYYSSLGPNNHGYTGGTESTKPDICAPAGVTSQAYAYEFHGTSAATPHVAGVAALIKGVYPYYTAEQLKDYIETNGFDIDPSGKDNTYGSGATQLPTSLTIIESEALKATALKQESGNAALQLTGIPGEQYTVMARDSMSSGSWQEIGTATIAADGTATFTDTGPLPQSRFYKLVK